MIAWCALSSVAQTCCRSHRNSFEVKLVLRALRRALDSARDGNRVKRGSRRGREAQVGWGERIRDDGRFLTVWKLDDGVWRITQAMFNSMRPIGSGTSRFLVRLKNRADQSALDRSTRGEIEGR